MNCSPAKLEANRKNAQRSTGPQTLERKNVSRANALKHGLCASVIVPEDPAAIQKRAMDLFDAFKPSTEYQAFNIDRAAVLTLRIECVERMERRLRDRSCLRAELTWDDDRRLEAEVLGGMLSKKPAETVESLRRTLHGCEWLISRWALLAHAADTQPDHAWTPEQTALAFDLMATPAMFRVGCKPGTLVDFYGKVIDAADDSAAVARRMVDELMECREVVRGLDEVDRALAVADMTHDQCAELRQLRRYESMLHNRLRWTIKQMTFQGPLGNPDPACRPKWEVDPVPVEKPKPKSANEKAAEAHDPTSWNPPLDLTPDKFPPISQKADIPAILTSRKEKKLARADARREAKRRKAEKLHA